MQTKIQQKTFLEKCIKLRQKIEQSDSPKQEIEKLSPQMQIALLIGFNITSLKELKTKI